MARLFSYIVAADTGFAPNPYHGYCTLATCKPRIRGSAEIGDWIVGTGSKANGRNGCLVYAMKVSEVMSFDEYWNDPRFLAKRPDTSSDKKNACGDNIYYRDRKFPIRFRQVPSYHSCPDGRQDYEKLVHDTSVDQVLIGDDFIYWGGSGPPLPEVGGIDISCVTQGYKCRFRDVVVKEFIEWISDIKVRGCLGEPLDA